MMIKTYYQLTKPGIVYGNSIAAIAGFLLASKGGLNISLFVSMLAGISLIIASACVFNNYIDKDIDKKMSRTKKRALVTQEISGASALLFGAVLGGVGTYLLLVHVNVLAAAIALFGMFAYVVLYGIAKRMTVWGTVVGSVSGAIPPVVGYVAATNNLDLGALVLFLILVCWQMPHFYAIALFREKEYKAAGVPVLPLVKGAFVTKVQIFLYILGFTFAVWSLAYFGYAGLSYLLVMSVVCIMWARLSIKGFGVKNTKGWARELFGFSLITLLIFCTMISLDAWLP